MCTIHIYPNKNYNEVYKAINSQRLSDMFDTWHNKPVYKCEENNIDDESECLIEVSHETHCHTAIDMIEAFLAGYWAGKEINTP